MMAGNKRALVFPGFLCKSCSLVLASAYDWHREMYAGQRPSSSHTLRIGLCQHRGPPPSFASFPSSLHYTPPFKTGSPFYLTKKNTPCARKLNELKRNIIPLYGFTSLRLFPRSADAAKDPFGRVHLNRFFLRRKAGKAWRGVDRVRERDRERGGVRQRASEHGFPHCAVIFFFSLPCGARAVVSLLLLPTPEAVAILSRCICMCVSVLVEVYDGVMLCVGSQKCVLSGGSFCLLCSTEGKSVRLGGEMDGLLIRRRARIGNEKGRV